MTDRLKKSRSSEEAVSSNFWEGWQGWWKPFSRSKRFEQATGLSLDAAIQLRKIQESLRGNWAAAHKSLPARRQNIPSWLTAEPVVEKPAARKQATPEPVKRTLAVQHIRSLRQTSHSVRHEEIHGLDELFAEFPSDSFTDSLFASHETESDLAIRSNEATVATLPANRKKFEAKSCFDISLRQQVRWPVFPSETTRKEEKPAGEIPSVVNTQTLPVEEVQETTETQSEPIPFASFEPPSESPAPIVSASSTPDMEPSSPLSKTTQTLSSNIPATLSSDSQPASALPKSEPLSPETLITSETSLFGALGRPSRPPQEHLNHRVLKQMLSDPNYLKGTHRQVEVRTQRTIHVQETVSLRFRNPNTDRLPPQPMQELRSNTPSLFGRISGEAITSARRPVLPLPEQNPQRATRPKAPAFRTSSLPATASHQHDWAEEPLNRSHMNNGLEHTNPVDSLNYLARNTHMVQGSLSHLVENYFQQST